MTITRMSGPLRLADLGLSYGTIATVLSRADVETRSRSRFDPPSLAGLLRWGLTTRYLREELVPQGWTFDNPRNLARTIHPSREFAIVATTGDAGTGTAEHEAGPRHSKGYATELAIRENGQLSFDFGSLVHTIQEVRAISVGRLQTWFLLFHVDQDLIHAELSLPEGFSDGRMTDWVERILLPPVPRYLPPSPNVPIDETDTLDETNIDETNIDGAFTVGVPTAGATTS